MREGLIVKVREVLTETKSRVRIRGKRNGRDALDGKRGETRVPVGLDTINLVLAELEEEMERVRWEGVTLREGKVFTLSYVDDTVLIVEGEDETRSMIERIEGYMDKKGLDVNVGKTKIVRFRKREKKEGKMEMEGKGD